MTNQYNVLILTDHTRHSSENSLYDLANKMLRHPKTRKVDIASRANSENTDFFSCQPDAQLLATTVLGELVHQTTDHPLTKGLGSIDFASYDLVWLRLPPPFSKVFLEYLTTVFSKQCIINHPDGIYETGSKEFLVNFESVCPPIKVCRSVADILEFNKQFPIVLKPFREYAGRGIVRIDGTKVWKGKEETTLEKFITALEETEVAYLAVKFLKNVAQGDKRIVVVNGQILGASLRLPAEDSWICNVAMGGSSNPTDITPEEEEIIATINPTLLKMGIVMYGVDTLVNDDGKRVLSEINTTSIGGLPQIAKHKNKPLVEKAIDLIWNYFESTKTQS